MRAVGLIAFCLLASATTRSEGRSPETPLRHVSGSLSGAAGEKPAAGRFLVATRTMSGPIFGRTVILLLEYSQRGAMGLVVNRPSDALLGEVLPEFVQYVGRRDRIHFGGPVEGSRMIFLVRADEPPSRRPPIVEDVYSVGSPLRLKGLLRDGIPTQRFRVYAGYSGWGGGQLDAELARGDWYVASAGAEAIFGTPSDDLWEQLVADFEGTQVRQDQPRAPMAMR